MKNKNIIVIINDDENLKLFIKFLKMINFMVNFII